MVIERKNWILLETTKYQCGEDVIASNGEDPTREYLSKDELGPYREVAVAFQ